MNTNNTVVSLTVSPLVEIQNTDLQVPAARCLERPGLQLKQSEGFLKELLSGDPAATSDVLVTKKLYMWLFRLRPR